MLAPAMVDEVRRLLAAGRLSQRAIARRTGVSRGTVGAIAGGRRPDYPLRPRDAEEPPQGPPRRCPDCGGMVSWPCRLCRTRRAMTRPGHRRPPVEVGRRTAAVGMELRGEHQQRYLRVRARKLRQLRRSGELTPRNEPRPNAAASDAPTGERIAAARAKTEAMLSRAATRLTRAMEVA